MAMVKPIVNIVLISSIRERALGYVSLCFLRITGEADHLGTGGIVDVERKIIAGKHIVQLRWGQPCQGNFGTGDLSFELLDCIILGRH